MTTIMCSSLVSFFAVINKSYLDVEVENSCELVLQYHVNGLTLVKFTSQRLERRRSQQVGMNCPIASYFVGIHYSLSLHFILRVYLSIEGRESLSS